MAYASWSVVFGEQPTAAKWNLLGSNDASFNDGTGIGTNAVAAASLAQTAIHLGNGTSTSAFATTSATSVQVTGVTVTVTIPSGSRKVLIGAGGGQKLVVSGGTGVTSKTIWDGVVGVGTQLAKGEFSSNGYVPNEPVWTAPQTVSAGSKTYNLGVDISGGFTLTWTGSATFPIWIAAFVV